MFLWLARSVAGKEVSTKHSEWQHQANSQRSMDGVATNQTIVSLLCGCRVLVCAMQFVCRSPTDAPRVFSQVHVLHELARGHLQRRFVLICLQHWGLGNLTALSFLSVVSPG